MDETVVVKFDPPAKVVSQTSKCWVLATYHDDSHEATDIPKKVVVGLDVGESYPEIAMPKWLAVDRGLVEADDDTYHPPEPPAVPITRFDLLQAAALNGLLVRGEDSRYAVYESYKIAQKAMEAPNG